VQELLEPRVLQELQARYKVRRGRKAKRGQSDLRDPKESRAFRVSKEIRAFKDLPGCREKKDRKESKASKDRKE
jgi:hypothetical protein